MRISTTSSAPRKTALILIVILVLAASSASAWPVATVIPHSAPVWTASGQLGLDLAFGSSIASAGDINHDGFSDVVVGSPEPGPFGNQQGRVLLYLGGPSGLSSAPVWTLVGQQEWSQLGASVSSAGDFNRDGYDDIAIGEWHYNVKGFEEGRALVYFGSRRGIQPGWHWEVVGTENGENLGQVVASAGDVNGDGIDDLLILSQKASRVFHGHAGRPDNHPDWTGPASSVGTGIGDINGDGFDDIALETNAGTLVYLGSAAGLSTSPAWTGPSAMCLSGRGDVNGDGIADLLLASSDITQGGLRLYLGSPNGLGPSPSWQAFRGMPAGTSISLEGDVNGDGHADVAVATPSQLNVYLSEYGTPSLRPDWEAVFPAYSHFIIVALGPDVDGDGSSEVLASNPEIGGENVGGQAYLYKLGPAYPAPAIVHEPPPALIAPGSPLPLQAFVTDWTRSVARVEIHYRYVEDFDYQPPITMQMTTDWDWYAGTIPAAAGYSAGFVYFIRAYDDYGLAGETEPVGVDYDYGAMTPRGAFSARVRSAPGGSATEIVFTTTHPGPATLRVFDVAGRLVATLLRESSLAPGEHRLPVGAAALRTRNGVFFYRLETAEGVRSGRLIRLPGRE